MTVLFAARSASLSKWAADVGLGKHIYRVGLAADLATAKAEAAGAGWAGETDWTVVASQPAPDAAPDIDEAAALAGVARKEKPVDPDYYPRLKGLSGVFRVSLEHVQNAMLVAQAMLSPDAPLVAPKPKPKDIGAYLLRLAAADAPTPFAAPAEDP